MIQPFTVTTRMQIYALAALLVAAMFGSYYLGVRSSAPAPEVIAPAAAQSQADGSVIAERRPEAKPTPAPHMIPQGAVEERRVSVTVQPRANLKVPAAGQSAPLPDPVHVDLSLIRQGDGRRVVASSPDGDVIGALDVPIEPALMPAAGRPWAAGLTCSVGDSCALRTAGVIVQRDFERVRAGVEAYRRADGKATLRAQLLWRW